MSFRYELRYTDGEDAGTFHSAVPDWWGGIFQTGDGRKLRIVSAGTVAEQRPAMTAENVSALVPVVLATAGEAFQQVSCRITRSVTVGHGCCHPACCHPALSSA
jgi:hypothetical protein